MKIFLKYEKTRRWFPGTCIRFHTKSSIYFKQKYKNVEKIKNLGI